MAVSHQSSSQASSSLVSVSRHPAEDIAEDIASAVDNLPDYMSHDHVRANLREMMEWVVGRLSPPLWVMLDDHLVLAYCRYREEFFQLSRVWQQLRLKEEM